MGEAGRVAFRGAAAHLLLGAQGRGSSAAPPHPQLLIAASSLGASFPPWAAGQGGEE